MASVAVDTAVSKPKVRSVASRSLSMVLGHADHRHSFLGKTVGDLEAAVAAHGDVAEEAHSFEIIQDFIGDVNDLDLPGKVFHRFGEGVALVGGAEDGAALGEDALHVLRVQANEVVLVEQSAVAGAAAVDLPALAGG